MNKIISSLFFNIKNNLLLAALVCLFTSNLFCADFQRPHRARSAGPCYHSASYKETLAQYKEAKNQLMQAEKECNDAQTRALALRQDALNYTDHLKYLSDLIKDPDFINSVIHNTPNRKKQYGCRPPSRKITQKDKFIVAYQHYENLLLQYNSYVQQTFEPAKAKYVNALERYRAIKHFLREML